MTMEVMILSPLDDPEVSHYGSQAHHFVHQQVDILFQLAVILLVILGCVVPIEQIYTDSQQAGIPIYHAVCMPVQERRQKPVWRLG